MAQKYPLKIDSKRHSVRVWSKLLQLRVTITLLLLICVFIQIVVSCIDAWITSGGSYNGCMKLVGQAFENNALSVSPDEKVVVLGIASWCSVTNKEKLKIDHVIISYFKYT